MVSQKTGPQEAREQRARQQFGNYTFRLEEHPAAGAHVLVTKKADGTVHVVTPAACSCEDFNRRGFEGGFSCKHLAMVNLWLSNGEGLI